MAAVAFGALAAGGATAAGYASYAALAYTIASTVATAYLRTPNKTYGPRLTDLTVTTSAYGTPIPKVYGTIRVNGNMFWSTNIQERSHKKKVGGKGGIIGKKDTNTTYSYSQSFGLLVASNAIDDVRKMMFDGDLVYDKSKSNEKATTSLIYSAFRVYKSGKDQKPDPTMQAHDGVNKTPAYKKYSYVFFENLNLDAWGGRLPNITMEVVGEADTVDDISADTWTLKTDGPYGTNARQIEVFDNENQKMYSKGQVGDDVSVVIVDLIDNTAKEKIMVDGYSRINVASDTIFTTGDYIVGNSQGHKLINAYDTDFNIKKTMNPHQFRGYVPEYTYRYRGDNSYALRMSLTNYLIFNFTESLIGNSYLNISVIASFIFDEGNAQYYIPFPIDTSTNQEYQPSQFVDLWGAGGTENKVLMDDENIYIRCQKGNNLEIYSIPFATNFNRIELIATISNFVINTNTKNVFYYDEISENMIMTGEDPTSKSSGNTLNDKIIVTYNLRSEEVRRVNIETKYIKPYAGTSAKSRANPFYLISNSQIGVVYQLTNTIIHNFQISLNDFDSFSYYKSEGNNPQNGTIGVNPTYFNTQMQYIYSEAFSRQYYRIIIDRVIKKGLEVNKIIKTMCLDAGIPEDKIDTTNIDDIVVRGYADTSGGAFINTLMQLQDIYDIEIIKSNYKNVFKKTKGDIVRVIDMSELGAQQYSSSTSYKDAFVTENAEEKELPSSVEATYFDYDNNYVQTTQKDTDPTALVVNAVNNEYPVVLTANEAKALVQRQLDTARVTRYKYSFSLSYNHYDLEAGDIIQVVDKDRIYTMKILTAVSDIGIIKISAQSYDNVVYDQSVAKGDAGQGIKNDTIIKQYSESVLEYMDIPLLDNNDFIGAYVGTKIRNKDEKWVGSVLQMSQDGINYLTKNDFDDEIVDGYSISVLNDFNEGNVFDYYNFVDVYTTFELESKTENEVLNGENTCKIGDEILQFSNVELVSTNVYRLSGLLRKRFQTDGNTHTLNEKFILLETSTIERLFLNNTNINNNLFLRNVSYKTDESRATVSNYIFLSKNQIPMRIQGADSNRDGLNNWNFFLYEIYRGQNYLQPYSVAKDLDNNNYSIDILRADNTVVRTINVTNSNKFSYTSEQQVIDFGSVRTTIKANIYKLNVNVGRGKVYNLVA